MERAISLVDVTKSYRLFESPWEMTAYALGLGQWPLPGVRREVPEFLALRNVSLEICRGEQVGVIGRNGAGKTTLLKVITGATLPTLGSRYVQGSIEALFDASIGFHPEISGYENIRNGLRLRLGSDNERLDEAIEDVIDFVELGDFLHQPIGNYSKGMRARLTFAVATAIRPEMVVIDEILGAGDSYFSSKAARRMKTMLGHKCTLVLVTHSSSQILQFCERVIWVERGEIVMDGEPLKVVKAYEEFIEKLRLSSKKNKAIAAQTVSDLSFRRDILDKTLASVQKEITAKEKEGQKKPAALAAPETPAALPKPQAAAVIEGEEPCEVESNVTAPGGASRWPGHKQGVTIHSVTLRDNGGREIRVVETHQPFTIDIAYRITETGHYCLRFVLLFFTHDGRWLTRQLSEPEELDGVAGESYVKQAVFAENYFGGGDIIFTVAIFDYQEEMKPEDNYDTLSRSFGFKVINPEKKNNSLFVHPSRWEASNAIVPEDMQETA